MANLLGSLKKRFIKKKPANHHNDEEQAFLGRIVELKEQIAISPADDHIPDFSKLIKEFFQKHLKLKYEFTYEELAAELDRRKIDMTTKKQLFELIDSITAAQYGNETQSKERMLEMVGRFEDIAIKLTPGDTMRKAKVKKMKEDLAIEFAAEEERRANKAGAVGKDAQVSSTMHDQYELINRAYEALSDYDIKSAEAAYSKLNKLLEKTPEADRQELTDELYDLRVMIDRAQEKASKDSSKETSGLVKASEPKAVVKIMNPFSKKATPVQDKATSKQDADEDDGNLILLAKDDGPVRHELPIQDKKESGKKKKSSSASAVRETYTESVVSDSTLEPKKIIKTKKGKMTQPSKEAIALDAQDSEGSSHNDFHQTLHDEISQLEADVANHEAEQGMKKPGFLSSIFKRKEKNEAPVQQAIQPDEVKPVSAAPTKQSKRTKLKAPPLPSTGSSKETISERVMPASAANYPYEGPHQPLPKLSIIDHDRVDKSHASKVANEVYGLVKGGIMLDSDLEAITQSSHSSEISNKKSIGKIDRGKTKKLKVSEPPVPEFSLKNDEPIPSEQTIKEVKPKPKLFSLFLHADKNKQDKVTDTSIGSNQMSSTSTQEEVPESDSWSESFAQEKIHSLSDEPNNLDIEPRLIDKEVTENLNRKNTKAKKSQKPEMSGSESLKNIVGLIRRMKSLLEAGNSEEAESVWTELKLAQATLPLDLYDMTISDIDEIEKLMDSMRYPIYGRHESISGTNENPILDSSHGLQTRVDDGPNIVGLTGPKGQRPKPVPKEKGDYNEFLLRLSRKDISHLKHTANSLPNDSLDLKGTSEERVTPMGVSDNYPKAPTRPVISKEPQNKVVDPLTEFRNLLGSAKAFAAGGDSTNAKSCYKSAESLLKKSALDVKTKENMEYEMMDLNLELRMSGIHI